MAVTKDFLEYVLDKLSGWGNVYTHKMFGGAALYQEGLAFGMVADDTVYLKVDDTNKDKYIKAGSLPLMPFKSHATVLSFYNIPSDIFEDTDNFKKWAKESYEIQYKRSL
ncbi:MAG: TfoX/Sxy family protein [Bacteroidales bacterium]